MTAPPPLSTAALVEREEKIVQITGECFCDEAYTSRDLIAPDCVYHDCRHGIGELLDLLTEARGLLEWYGENARLARLIHGEGDAGRDAIAGDGGKRARAFLSRKG